MKRVSSPPQFFLQKLYVVLLISNPPRVGIKSEAYNVLTLRGLSHVKPNSLMIMPLKPLMKLRFGFGIMP